MMSAEPEWRADEEEREREREAILARRAAVGYGVSGESDVVGALLEIARQVAAQREAIDASNELAERQVAMLERVVRALERINGMVGLVGESVRAGQRAGRDRR